MRGFATLIVVFTHMGLLNRAGWVALQCFFVMSGFLISRVLLDLKLRYGARRYFGEFYTFRVLRIVPAYWLYITLLALGAWLIVPDFFARLRPLLPLLYSFVFNYSWAFTTEPMKTPWIGHLWSMSVEEQFYLAWPLLLWLTPIRRLPWVAGFLVLGGPLLRWLIRPAMDAGGHAGHDFDTASMVWVATPSHLDAFACGALLCFDGVRPAPGPRYPMRRTVVLILLVIACGVAWNHVFGSGARTALPGLSRHHAGRRPVCLGLLGHEPCSLPSSCPRWWRRSSATGWCAGGRSTAWARFPTASTWCTTASSCCMRSTCRRR